MLKWRSCGPLLFSYVCLALSQGKVNHACKGEAWMDFLINV